MVVRLGLFFVIVAMQVSCGAGLEAGSVERATQVPNELPPDPETPDQPASEAPVEPVVGVNFLSPELDSNFSLLPNGKLLSSIKVSGSSLTLTKGTGYAFGATQQQNYLKLKAATLAEPEHKVRWAMIDLDNGAMISQSLSAHRRIFGASSSKIYVAGTLLDQRQGVLSSSQMQKMADMIVVSSNTAWTALQSEIGNGSSDKGREINYKFTQRLGHLETRGFQGYWGNMHGNELVASEAVQYLHDIYWGNFVGAEYLWKLMYTGRTGSTRGKKYIPKTVYVGGKTGTYDGPTENPDTGNDYQVRIRNHIVTVNVNGHQFGIAVFSNSGSDEDVALLIGGLLREYAGMKD